MKLKTGEQNHRRHKCSICGQVRFEKFMEIITHEYSYSEKTYQLKTRYGNLCWVCVDYPDCQHKAKSFQPY